MKANRRRARSLLRSANVVRRCRDSVRWYRRWGTLPVRTWIVAAEAFKQEDFSTAAKRYRRGLAKRPKHPAASSAQFDLAYCLYRLDDFEGALKELESLIRGRTSLKEAYLLQARILLIIGQTLSAAKTMHLCRELFPEDLQVLSCLTHTVLVSKLPPDELDELKQELYCRKHNLGIDDERNVHLDTALAHFEIRCGDLRKGERMLARVLATGIAPFEAVLLRGERLLEQGRILPAREQLIRAMTAARKDPRPAMLLSKSYLRTGVELNPQWALQLAEAACRLSQWKNAECLSVLIRAYEANDQASTAQLFAERMKNLPSMQEVELSYFQSSLQTLRAQKLFNT